MWARIVEFMLACWLALSPFVFAHRSDATLLWTSDLTCAFLVALFSLLSFNQRLNKMHLGNLLVAFWLIWVAFSWEFPHEKAIQNNLVLAMLFLMLAIVPSESHLPPRPWRTFLKEKEDGKKT